jgi:TPR repeat protein
MSLRFPIAVVLSIVCLAMPAWAGFETGMGGYQRGNYATALSEWRPLAQQGDPSAQFYLGLLHEKGHGVPQDYTKARKWYEKAAAQGYAMGQLQLGLLYANGDGVQQDYAKARQWYEKAAAQGYAMAQSNLGMLYKSGNGVSQDNVRAYMWFSLAAAHSTGNLQKPAADSRDNVARRLTPAQLIEAQKLAREWRPKGK